MRLLLATDAWTPQINGVVRTISEIVTRAPDFGLDIRLVTPSDFRTVALPGYPEIRLAVSPRGKLRRITERWQPDAIHVATEGPIGLAARRIALDHGFCFTTSYHSRFPEYLNARIPVPVSWTYAWFRRFHNAGCGTMCATPSLEDELRCRGFRRLMRWSRGVDLSLFSPSGRKALDLPRPIFLNVGRIAVEKNLEAFLALDLPGSKVVVGDGPARRGMEARFPDVHFLGAKRGEELAAIYRSADVFVFPSRTDTYGLVLVEALASGLPVAAFPVMGPRDIISTPTVGILSDDLRAAAVRALDLDRRDCAAFAKQFSWDDSARIFAANVGIALEDFRNRKPAPPDQQSSGMGVMGGTTPLPHL